MPLGVFRLLRGGAAPVTFAAGPWRALYVQTGAMHLADRPDPVTAGTGVALGPGPLHCRPATPDTLLWVWEWARRDPGPVPDAAALALTHPVSPYGDERPDLAVLRMERVALHPGAETARHTHAGCGLRVLVAGHIDADVGAARLSLHPGDCWLERGPGEPVIGRAGTQGAAFVRVMVLADGMQGQDSYRAWDDAAAQRGRPASYTQFFETEVTS